MVAEAINQCAHLCVAERHAGQRDGGCRAWFADRVAFLFLPAMVPLLPWDSAHAGASNAQNHGAVADVGHADLGADEGVASIVGGCGNPIEETQSASEDTPEAAVSVGGAGGPTTVSVSV